MQKVFTCTRIAGAQKLLKYLHTALNNTEIHLTLLVTSLRTADFVAAQALK